MSLLAVAGLACTEPSYGTTPDAGSAISNADAGSGPRAEGTDAGPGRLESQDAGPSASPVAADAETAGSLASPDAGASSWWTPMAAHENYAVRAQFFSRDRALGNNVAYSHEILLWAKVRIDAASGNVTMEARRCADHGVITTSVTLRDDFGLTFPTRLAPEQHTLVLRDGKIRSESPARTLGYLPTQPDECTPGARIDARPDQVWLRDGKCECRTEPLPILATDCRVTDADQDGQPGVNIKHVGFPAMVEAARVKDASQIVDGVLDADGRMRATYVQNFDVLDLSCGSSPCAHDDVFSCPLELNPVHFEPLPDVSPSGEPWSCESVIREAERLLPSQMLGFPVTGC